MAMNAIPRGRVPLERALSKLGLASRTQARRWILEGRMKVNGVIRRDPQFAVIPETARIEVLGGEGEAFAQPVVHIANAHFERRVLLLHKPSGVVTTRSDEKGRATVFSLLGASGKDPDPAVHLHAVGRLDMATTGLLLLTNDTQLSSWLTDPNNAVPRVYLVTVRGEFADSQARRLETGVLSDGDRLKASRIQIRKPSRKETHLVVTLVEGKNREIRRMFEECGLKRVSYGNLELGDLAPGQSRELTSEEIASIAPGVPISR